MVFSVKINYIQNKENGILYKENWKEVKVGVNKREETLFLGDFSKDTRYKVKEKKMET